MNKLRILTAATAAVATAGILAGCTGGGMSGMDMGSGSGGSASSPAPSPASSSSAAAEFNQADVAFAQNMIVHHQGAIDMADVILAKDGIDQRVVDLATQIKAAQAPEIEQLRTWLGEWGAPEMGADMGGMNMNMDMTGLENATGVEATRMFLEQMKVHHQGAITMAQTQIDTGANPDAITMAENIVRTQTEEIATIDSILATL